MPCLMNRFINCGVDLLIPKIYDLFGASVKICIETANKFSPVSRRRDLLWRNGSDADFLVRGDRPSEEPLDCGLDEKGQFACPLNRDVLHGVNRFLFLCYQDRDGAFDVHTVVILFRYTGVQRHEDRPASVAVGIGVYNRNMEYNKNFREYK